MSWQKGKSGNPSGRPKKHKALAPALRAMLDKKRIDGQTNRDALLLALFETALAGDVTAIRTIFERVDGKVPDSLEISGADGGPQRILVEYADNSPDAT